MHTNEILNILQNKMESAVFATIDENNKPHARYMYIGLANFEGLFFAVNKDSYVYKELQMHPDVAVIRMEEDNYLIQLIQIEGVVRELDSHTFAKAVEESPALGNVYTADMINDETAIFQLYNGDGRYTSLTQGHEYTFTIGKDDNVAEPENMV